VFISTVFSSVPTSTLPDLNTAVMTASATHTNTATPTATVTQTPSGGCGQNFDGVVTPAFPVGWSSTATGAGAPWETTHWITAHSPPNAVLAPAPSTAGTTGLITPTYFILPSGGAFSFRTAYGFEMFADGMVLEISVDGGAFQDILSAGGSFSAGGYNNTISEPTSPINGRQAWTGNSAPILVIVVLPATAHGHNIQLQWKVATDEGAGGVGAWIDTVIGIPCSTGPTPTNTATPTFTPTPIQGSVSGTITYGNAIGSPTTRPVSDVSVSATGPSNIFTSTLFPSGDYSLSGFLVPGTYIVSPTKADGVNGISSFDAARVAQHVAGVNILTGAQFTVANASGNGGLTSFDAALIARYIAGLSDYGLTTRWVFQPVNRIYSDITSNITGQDYSALLMGEVSGNWTNTVGSRQLAEDSRQLAVAVGRQVTLEKEIVVPVNVEGVANKEVISYEFDLRYDPSVIQPVGDAVDLKGTVSRGLTFVTNAEQPGLLRVVAYGVMPIDGDGLLLNLRFIAVGKGSISPLTFENFLFNEDLRVRATDGKIELF